MKPRNWAGHITTVVVLTVLGLLPGTAGASFTPPETISAPGVQAFADDIATDGRGNALAVWSTVYPGPDLVQARFRSRTGAWGPVTTLSASGEGSGTAQVAFDAHGNAIVAWSSFESLPGEEYIGTARVRAVFRPAGGSFGESQVVQEEVGELQFRVSDLAASEGAVLAWTRFAAGDEIPAVQVAFRAAGGSFATPVPMGRGDWPEVEIDRRDNAIVAWSREVGPENFPIYYSLRPAGEDLSPPTFLADAPGLAALAMDRRGNTLVTWNDYEDRLVMSFRPAGRSFGPEQVVAGARGGDAAFDDRGNAVLVWLTDFPRGRVMTMTRLADGTLTRPQTLSAPGETFHPVVAADKGAVVVWPRADVTGPLSRGNFEIEAAFSARPAKRPFGAPELVSGPGHDAFNPHVALNRQGAALVIWTRGDPYEYSQPRSVQFSTGRP
jgi:hypothetical protein